MDEIKVQNFINEVRVRRHQMYRIALSLLHDPQDAEDAVSAAVEATWRNLPRLRTTDAIPAYLLHCTVNAARGEWRRKRRKPVCALEELQEEPEAENAGEPILHYLSGLKERDQLLLILKYQEELRDAEIGSILHMPRGTVSSRIGRLLKKLREEMEREEKSYGD